MPLIPYLEARGVKVRKFSRFSIAKCPLHRERHGESFVVWPGDGRWKCYGKCDTGGDIVDLVAKWNGISLADAAKHLVESVPGLTMAPAVRVAVARPAEVEVTLYQLTRPDRERMATAAHRLACDSFLVNKLCQARSEWDPEAVRGVAQEGDLGYEAGTLLFGYRNGIKRRRKGPDGSRRFDWVCGSPHGECWRQPLLLASHHTAVITEGESDALTVISMGIEIPGEVLVLALPGATSFPKPEPFRDKTIVLVPDADRAGQGCVERLSRSLGPVAASIKVADMMPEGVTHA